MGQRHRKVAWGESRNRNITFYLYFYLCTPLCPSLATACPDFNREGVIGSEFATHIKCVKIQDQKNLFVNEGQSRAVKVSLISL